MITRPRRHPYSLWRWWQVAGTGVFVFGGFGLLVGLLPEYSPAALAAGLSLAVLGTLAGIWNWRAYSHRSRLVTALVWCLQFLLIAVRAWVVLNVPLWAWLPALLMVFVAAWTLPFLQPRLSGVFWREQTAPRSRAGRGCLVLALMVTPIAGVLGGSFGMIGSRLGQTTLVWLLVGVLGAISAVAISFSTAYQLWADRRLANEKEPGE
jgi:hypothetical protein